MLDLVLDSDGVMRVGGRIWKVNLLCILNKFVILLKLSYISLLIISYIYERIYYSGRGINLNEFCFSGYWIVSGNVMF